MIYAALKIISMGIVCLFVFYPFKTNAQENGYTVNLSKDYCVLNGDIDGRIISTKSIERCRLEQKQYVKKVKLEKIRFDLCYFVDFSMHEADLNDVQINNSYIKRLEFTDSEIKNLAIRNSDIVEIIIKRSQVDDLKIIGGSVGKINIIDSNVESPEFAYFVFDDICIDGGLYSKAFVGDLRHNPHSKFQIKKARIEYPLFDDSIIKILDLTRSNIDIKNFKLLNEYHADNEEYGKTQCLYIYEEVRDIYYILSQLFYVDGLYEMQRHFEYRMYDAKYKSETSAIKKAQILLWDVFLRGDYGYSPFNVLIASSVVWFIFTSIYFFMGRLKVGWALFVPLNILGNALADENPKFINANFKKNNVEYLLDCGTFSLHQLIYVGFKKYGMTTVNIFGFIPKHIVTIGIGVIIAMMEKAIGLLLIFNFIQAFLRTL